MFGRNRWPSAQLEDADLFGNLLDAVFAAGPADAVLPLRELARLAGIGPDHTDRTLWQWCAAWARACSELDEPLLALKIVVFVDTWPATFADHPVTAWLYLGTPSSNDIATVRAAALTTASELDDHTIVRKPDGLTVTAVSGRLARGEPMPVLVRPGSAAFSGSSIMDTLDDQRRALIERRCSFHWATMTDFLLPGEVVRAACPVTLPSLRLALLALTDDRLLIARGNAFGFREPTCVQIDLQHVLSASYTAGKFRDADGFKDMVHSSYELVIEARTGTFSVAFAVRGTPKNEGPLWPNLILEYKDRKAAYRAPSTSAHASLATDLEKIAALHRDGLLSESEYRAAKARVLNLET